MKVGVVRLVIKVQNSGEIADAVKLLESIKDTYKQYIVGQEEKCWKAF